MLLVQALRAITTMLAGYAATPDKPPLVIVAGLDASGACIFDVGAKRFDQEHLLDFVRRHAAEREVVLTFGDSKPPYRCIGALIYTIQSAHIPVRIGFVSEPADPKNGK